MKRFDHLAGMYFERFHCNGVFPCYNVCLERASINKYVLILFTAKPKWENEKKRRREDGRAGCREGGLTRIKMRNINNNSKCDTYKQYHHQVLLHSESILSYAMRSFSFHKMQIMVLNLPFFPRWFSFSLQKCPPYRIQTYTCTL